MGKEHRDTHEQSGFGAEGPDEQAEEMHRRTLESSETVLGKNILHNLACIAAKFTGGIKKFVAR